MFNRKRWNWEKIKEGDKITPKGGYYLDKLYYRKDRIKI